LSFLAIIFLKIKDAIEIEHSICNFLLCRPILEPFCDYIIKKNTNTSNNLDIGARLVKFYLNFHDYNYNKNYLQECIDKYPSYTLFYYFHGGMLSFLDLHDIAIKKYHMGLQLDPNNTEILYNIAVSFRLINKKETKLAYEAFLEKADKRHRKYPEAFYGIAVYLISENISSNPDKNYKKVEHFYNLGLEAEKNQLFCYLPYNSNSKNVVKVYLEGILSITKHLSTNSSKNLLSAENKINSTQLLFNKNIIFDYDYDLYRKELILNERRTKRDFYELFKDKTVIQSSLPRNKRIIQNYTNLTKIMLSDVDLTYDHIEKGKFFLVAVIEQPNLNYTSLMTVVEDEENSVQRIAIYNLKESKEQLFEEFKVGTVLKIMNPYIRLAIDMKPIIRIDDIDSFKIVERINKPCYMCLKPDCSLTCGKCKTSKYCSKECQLIDWNTYNHSLVCGIK
jgi:hypothetical protein